MAKPAGKRPGSRRVRRIRQSLAAVGAGLFLLTALGWWLAFSRDTDRQDPAAGLTDLSDQQIPANAPKLHFENVAAKLGVTMRHGPGERRRTLPEDTGSGLAWGDYDGDGDFDLYLVNYDAVGHGSQASNRLYRNDGGRFVDATARAAVGDATGFGMGATFADYDDDGDLDLYVTNRGPNRLFSNLGDGSFREIGAAAGVDDPSWSVGAAWADFDLDGRLDLYVANYVDFDDSLATAPTSEDPNWTGVPIALNPNAFDPLPNRLYRQRQDGRFIDDAVLAGVSDPAGRSLGVAALDADDDGRPDIYVANDVSPNALFLNRGREPGEALFEDASAATGTADPRGSMGVCVGNFADDPGPGLPSLFITHWVAQENALYEPVIAVGGRLEYRDRARQRRVAEVSLDRVGWGCAAADFDADGRVDLMVANGSTLESSEHRELTAQPALLHWNAGDHFVDLAPVAGDAMRQKHVARGLAVADFDGDGDLDAAVNRNRDVPLLLQNQGIAGLTSEVRTLGTGSWALGSRLSVLRAGSMKLSWWLADASFASAHAPQHLIGLGLDRSSPLLICLDPPSDTERCYTDLEAGRTFILAR